MGEVTVNGEKLHHSQFLDVSHFNALFLVVKNSTMTDCPSFSI